MRRRLAISLVFAPALAACNPHSASADGEFTALLSVSSSRTLFKETVNLGGFADAGGSHAQIDCRDPDDFDILPDADPALCAGIDDFEHEQWMQLDGYEVLTLPLEPWRGEAVMTSEGDLQITFHNHLPGQADFRFAIVVDPTFQPTQCSVGANGEGERTNVDGDWIQNWSNDLPTWDPPAAGTLFYLNQGAYQFNPHQLDPNKDDHIWALPERWQAGTSIAKYGEEDFYIVAPRYAYPFAYDAYDSDQASSLGAEDLFHVQMDADADPTTNAAFQDLIATTREVESQINNEYALAFGETAAPATERRVNIHSHTNEWRIPQGDDSGIDGWTELDYNWVRFDEDRADLAVGGTANGEFHLIMRSADSPSRLVIRGHFTVDKIKQDTWTLPNLSTEKLAEYGTELCGGATTF